jgi:ribosome-associated protein YbcJ (S4-like RNA binding protein)
MDWMRLRFGVVLALLASPLPLAFAATAFAQKPPSVTPSAAPRPQNREAVVVNELGLALRELYVAPAGSVEPGPDRLGQDTLPTGASLRVPLGRQNLCLFDLRAVLSDGSAEEKRGVDLCRNARVTFGDPTAPMREANVVNDTDLEIRELYAMPVGAPGRGPERLGADTVAPEATHVLRLGRARECVFDLTAVFEDDSTEQRRRVDLCRNRRVTFGDATIPWREAEIANGHGKPMRNLFATVNGPERWGPDRLGSETVEAGATFRLRLRARPCNVDIRVVYEDETAEVKTGLDLCQEHRVLFDGSGIPRPPERAFTLVNRHGAAVDELYASAIDETDWGDDRLSGNAMERGARMEVVLRSGCEIDLRIVFANGGAEERRGLDICNSNLVVLRPGWTLAERLDQGAGPVEPGPPREGSVRLRNAGPAPIVELYADKAGAPPGTPPGPDRLGTTVLGRGETLDFQPPDQVGCKAHLRAVFRNGMTVERPELDLCSGTEVSLP